MADIYAEGRAAYRLICKDRGYRAGQTGIRDHAKNPYGWRTSAHLEWRRGFEGEAEKHERDLRPRVATVDWYNPARQKTPGMLAPRPEPKAKKGWSSWL